MQILRRLRLWAWFCPFLINWTFFVIQTKKVANDAADSGEGYQKQRFKQTKKQQQQNGLKLNRKEDDGDLKAFRPQGDNPQRQQQHKDKRSEHGIAVGTWE